MFMAHSFSPSLCTGSHGVMVSTLDSESSDPSSNLGGTSKDFFLFFNLSRNKLIFFFVAISGNE